MVAPAIEEKAPLAGHQLHRVGPDSISTGLSDQPVIPDGETAVEVPADIALVLTEVLIVAGLVVALVVVTA
jgi:hypothetical protein